MKYHYFYQSKKNENLDGWIVAKNRDDAYAQLKKQGIHKVGQYSLRELRDECEGWDDDELEVTEC